MQGGAITWVYGLALLGVLGCGSSEADADAPVGVALQGDNACERWASLAAGLGCKAPASCTISAACDATAVSWIDCAARDRAQCTCEDDGELNCEGSHKPNEGPAHCVAEANALDACEG